METPIPTPHAATVQSPEKLLVFRIDPQNPSSVETATSSASSASAADMTVGGESTSTSASSVVATATPPAGKHLGAPSIAYVGSTIFVASVLLQRALGASKDAARTRRRRYGVWMCHLKGCYNTYYMTLEGALYTICVHPNIKLRNSVLHHVCTLVDACVKNLRDLDRPLPERDLQACAFLRRLIHGEGVPTTNAAWEAAFLEAKKMEMPDFVQLFVLQSAYFARHPEVECSSLGDGLCGVICPLSIRLINFHRALWPDKSVAIPLTVTLHCQPCKCKNMSPYIVEEPDVPPAAAAPAEEDDESPADVITAGTTVSTENMIFANPTRMFHRRGRLPTLTPAVRALPKKRGATDEVEEKEKKEKTVTTTKPSEKSSGASTSTAVPPPTSTKHGDGGESSRVLSLLRWWNSSISSSLAMRPSASREPTVCFLPTSGELVPSMDTLRRDFLEATRRCGDSGQDVESVGVMMSSVLTNYLLYVNRYAANASQREATLWANIKASAIVQDMEQATTTGDPLCVCARLLAELSVSVSAIQALPLAQLQRRMLSALVMALPAGVAVSLMDDLSGAVSPLIRFDSHFGKTTFSKIASLSDRLVVLDMIILGHLQKINSSPRLLGASSISNGNRTVTLASCGILTWLRKQEPEDQLLRDLVKLTHGHREAIVQKWWSQCTTCITATTPGECTEEMRAAKGILERCPCSTEARFAAAPLDAGAAAVTRIRHWEDFVQYSDRTARDRAQLISNVDAVLCDPAAMTLLSQPSAVVVAQLKVASDSAAPLWKNGVLRMLAQTLLVRAQLDGLCVSNVTFAQSVWWSLWHYCAHMVGERYADSVVAQQNEGEAELTGQARLQLSRDFVLKYATCPDLGGPHTPCNTLHAEVLFRALMRAFVSVEGSMPEGMSLFMLEQLCHMTLHRLFMPTTTALLSSSAAPVCFLNDKHLQVRAQHNGTTLASLLLQLQEVFFVFRQVAPESVGRARFDLDMEHLRALLKSLPPLPAATVTSSC